MTGTTFEKYGGFGAVSKVVMTLYEKVLELRAVHQQMAISDGEFDEVVQLLRAALAENGMDEGDTAELSRAVQAKRGLIVRSSGPGPSRRF